jgi:osmoprotectant transport system substrate-binding protein
MRLIRGIPPSPLILRKVLERGTLGSDLLGTVGCVSETRVTTSGVLWGLIRQVWDARNRIPTHAMKPHEWGTRRFTSHPSQRREGWGTQAFGAALTLLLLAALGCAPPRSSRVVIGAKNFTEQVVLGELLAQEIEAVSQEQGRPERVERRFYLAGSYLCQQALVNGRIDGYVEYTGTALTAILKQPLPPVGQRDAASVRGTVAKLYAQRYGVTVGAPLGFEDTFAMVVRGADARRLGIKTISDAVKTAPGKGGWRLGVGYEFQSRPDGLVGLEAAYGLKFAGAPRTMDLGLLYRALSSGQVDMVAGNSTDGPIRALGFVVLEDDRHYFPPYEAVPLVRADSIRAHPGIQVAMDRLAGKVSADEVRGMNDAVDGQHKDVGDVVRAFRKGKGL